MNPFPSGKSKDPLGDFFSDFYKQDICNATSLAFGPSWCTHRNAFVVPYLLSNASYPNTSSLTPNCSFHDSRGDAECRLIQTIAVGEFGPVNWQSNYNYSYFHDNDRFVFTGLVDGSIMVTDHNVLDGNESVLYIKERAHQAPVEEIIPLTNGTYGYLLTRDSNNVFKLWSGEDEPNTWRKGFAQCGADLPLVPAGYEFVKVQGWRHRYPHRKPQPALPEYVIATMLNCPNGYEIRYTYVRGCDDVVLDWREMKIEAEGSIRADLDLVVRNHEYNYTDITPIADTGLRDRPLIILVHPLQISVFAFEPDAMTQNVPFILPFNPNRLRSAGLPPSVFYRPEPGYTVSTATAFVDGIRRYFVSNTTGQIGGLPAQMIWLAVGITHSQGGSGNSTSKLEMFSLEEFGHFTMKEGANLTEQILDPSLRGPGFTACPVTSWDRAHYDTQKARPSMTPNSRFTPLHYHSDSQPAPSARLSASTTLSARSTEITGAASVQCAPRTVESLPLLSPPIAIVNQYRALATDLIPFVSVYFCNFYCLPVRANATLFQSCLNFFNIDVCPMDPSTLLSSTTTNVLFLRSTFSQFNMNMFYVQYDGVRTDIFGVQQRWGSQEGIVYRHFNTLDLVGRTMAITASENAQYMFAAIARPKWHMDSMVRLQEICDHLSQNHTHATEPLEEYEASCKSSTKAERAMNARHFAQMATACPPGTWCPSLRFELVANAEQGFYTIEAPQKRPCPPGAFCPMGQKMNCPIGHYCRGGTDTVPQTCQQNPELDETCYQDGLEAPTVCPPGRVCFAPYFPGLPVPPGHYVGEGPRVNSTGQFADCADGDFCALGRFNETTTVDVDGNVLPKNVSLECPPYFYCPHPYDVEPILCPCNESFCAYCPGGRNEPTPCPSGHFCTNQTSLKQCDKTDYCPAGSVIYKKCPAGSYCPTPAEKIECPKGSYCRKGSVSPTQCHFLSHCPAGTKDEQANYLGLVLDALLLIGAFLLVRFYRHRRDKRRKEREVKRRDAEELALIQKHTTEEGDAGDKGERLLESHGHDHEAVARSDLFSALPRKTMTIDFQFINLGLKLKGNGKTILAGVTGELRHGEVTAVMGPSGAGKTTFLSTLSDKAAYGVRTGEIFINNAPGDIRDYKQLVGFVPQEDIMLRMMTVKETLQFSATQRLPASMSSSEKTRIVNATIKVLGLEGVRHSAIGDERTRGISGGQRKRVNIGMELVADPTVLFLDEPTSGLDSTSSKEVCEALRNVAEMGLTIVTVIHQPRYEIFKMFHTVLLLGEGGRTVYLGPSEGALPYFEGLGFRCPDRVNPPDFFMDVISGMVEREGHPDFAKEDLFALWEDHSAKDNEERETRIRALGGNAPGAADTHIAGGLFRRKPVYRSLPSVPVLSVQFFWRACVQQTRDLLGMFLDCALVYLAGLCLGAIYADAKYYGPPPKEVSDLCPEPIRSRCELPTFDPVINQASLTTLALSLTTVMASLRVFGNEQIVYWREASHGGTGFTLAYFIGKVVSQFFNLLLWPLVYLTIYYTITAPRGTLREYYIILVLLCWAASGFAYLVSIVVPPHLAYLAGVVLMLIFQMVAGTMPTLKQLYTMVFPMPYMPYISFMRWGQEALYLTEIEGYQEVYDITASLDLYDYNPDNFSKCLGYVLLIGLVTRVIAYILMVVLHRGKKR